MIGALVTTILAAAVVKVFFAMCGHNITWRLAIALALIAGLIMMAIQGADKHSACRARTDPEADSGAHSVVRHGIDMPYAVHHTR